MDLQKIFTTKRLIFIAIFTVLVLIGKNVNFSPLVGAENQFFTLFQFFGNNSGGIERVRPTGKIFTFLEPD